jgi:hypothetical protein
MVCERPRCKQNRFWTMADFYEIWCVICHIGGNFEAENFIIHVDDRVKMRAVS